MSGSTGAEARIVDGRIEVSIDVDAIPVILSGSIAIRAVDGFYRVTDAEAFARAIAQALNQEDEEGTTLVHKMFDAAMNEAIDQGAEGADECSEEEFEAEAGRLQKQARSGAAS